MNVVIPFLIPLEKNILNSTRLLSNHPGELVQFSSDRFCCLVFEDAPLATRVIKLNASHAKGKPLTYSIIQGNEDGLFSLDDELGVISVAAPLDHEIFSKHTLVVLASADDESSSQTTVHIRVADINDNEPSFQVTDLNFEVIEEDYLSLPHQLTKIWAQDKDWVDKNRLLYTLIGDGVDGYAEKDAFFTIDSRTGQVTQLRPLDRDPPNGRNVWKLRVKVHDGQSDWATARISSSHKVKSLGQPSSIQFGEKIHHGWKVHTKGKLKSHKTKNIFDSAIKTNIENSEKWKSKNNQWKKESQRILQKPMKHRKFEAKLRKFKREVVKYMTRQSHFYEPLPKRRLLQNLEQNKLVLGSFANNWTNCCAVILENNCRQFYFQRSNLKSVFSKRRLSLTSKYFMATKESTYFECHKGRKKHNLHKKCQEERITSLQNQTSRKISAKTVFKPDKDEFFENSAKQQRVNGNEVLVRQSNTLKRGKFKGMNNNSSKNKQILRKIYGKIDTNNDLQGNSQERNNKMFSKKHPNYFESSKLSNISYIRDPKNLLREPRHISEIPLHKYDGENCDLFLSLFSPLDSEQEARLKQVASKLRSGTDYGGIHQNVHVVETELTISVKDINDNPPVFPNTTIHAQVQENGPVDLLVAMVIAWDADDPQSPTNAVLRYYLAKNAMDEKTGSTVFKIDTKTGEIRTALCCLDRETTLEYHLQVVATDGGGLKGTGTVAVHLTDVNDNSPRFTRGVWQVVIDETEGILPPNNFTLFEITVNDLDTSNNFLFRVVESSGWGWEFFGIRAVGSVGQVYAVKSLDYENERHRQGFRFLVQVTDKGSWPERPMSRLESTWVIVHLRNVNDNPPAFRRSFLRVALTEEAPPGTIVAKFSAVDPDEEISNPVNLTLLDDWSDLEINEDGEILTTSPLDRESLGGARGLVRIRALDNGTPPRSSTATLIVMVTDVNDCAPRILGPRVLHITENEKPKRIGTLLATDDDDWGLGHGPPFTFSLRDSNPSWLMDLVDLRFSQELDSGRGGAELWTKVALDREKNRHFIVLVTISDAANRESVNEVIISVDDVNDNDMKPGEKTIFIWKTEDTRGEYPIGRVFVDDPDDADGPDKQFFWADLSPPSRFFSLERSSGQILVSSSVPPGRYNLRFSVTDVVRQQTNVEANVRVNVRILDESSLKNAVALTFYPVRPETLAQDWLLNSSLGDLGKLTSILQHLFDDKSFSLSIVSVSKGHNPMSNTSPHPWSSDYILSGFSSSQDYLESSQILISIENKEDGFLNPSTTIWLAAKTYAGNYLSAIKLRGLLELKREKIENAVNLNVQFQDDLIQGSFSSFSPTHHPIYSPNLLSPSISLQGGTTPEGEARPPNGSHPQISSVEFKPVDLFPLQVVDANSTSLVSPLIKRIVYCRGEGQQRLPLPTNFSSPKGFSPSSCDQSSCLNGGKCVPTQWGKRCVCPGGTHGNFCKQTSLTFPFSEGFIWLQPLPPCLPLTISLEFASEASDGVILYSGPLSTRRGLHAKPKGQGNRKESSSTSMLALQLFQGHLQLIIEGFLGSHKLELRTPSSFSDRHWHHVFVELDVNGASVRSDYCVLGENGGKQSVNHCRSTSKWKRKSQARKYPWKVPWQVSLPLQVGGLAKVLPHKEVHRWSNQVSSTSFKGCIKLLSINKKLVDFGDAIFGNEYQFEGCHLHQELCLPACFPRGTCLNEGGDDYMCSCSPGYEGSRCMDRTVPLVLYTNAIKRISLKLKSTSVKTSLQLRFRTLARDVLILQLKSTNHTSLTLEINEGHLCLKYKRNRKQTQFYSFDKLRRNLSLLPHKPQIQNERTRLEINKPKNYTHPQVVPLLQAKSLRQQGQKICLTQRDCSDGHWHVVHGAKIGNTLVLEVDGGDEGGRNVTEFPALNDNHGKTSYDAFDLGQTEVVLGKDPKDDISFMYSSRNKSKLCIDDLRLNGQSVSFADINPNANSNQKSHTTRDEGDSCDLFDDCLDNSCGSTIECSKEGNHYLCGCPSKQTPTATGCQLYDPCLPEPCLHGGSCLKPNNGDSICLCPQTFSGNFCEWKSKHEDSYDFPLVALVATIFVILFAAIGGFLWWYVCRKSKTDTTSTTNTSTNTVSPKISRKFPFGSFLAGQREKEEVQIQVINVPEERQKRETELKSIPFNFLSLNIEDFLKGQELHTLPKDDLRAYAYEGDGSSSVSLGSASTALKEVSNESLELLPLTSTIREAVDLLKDLSDSTTQPPRKQ